MTRPRRRSRWRGLSHGYDHGYDDGTAASVHPILGALIGIILIGVWPAVLIIVVASALIDWLL